MTQNIPLTTDPKNHERVYRIAAEMIHKGLPPKFVQRAQTLALEYEGAFDLMVLWNEEADDEEKKKIICDLEEHIEDIRDHVQEKTRTRPKINFDDIATIGKDILQFKKRLRAIVDSNGGVPALSQKIGMSEPSLYRFFNSPSIPRRTTLYRIANALELEEKDIATEYIK